MLRKKSIQANLFAKFFNSAFIISSQPSCLEKQEHSVKQIIHNIELDRNLIAKLCNDLDQSKSRGPDLLLLFYLSVVVNL